MSLRKLRNSKSRLSFDADDLFSALGTLSEMAAQLVTKGSFSAATAAHEPLSALPELSSSRQRGGRRNSGSSQTKDIDFHAEGENVISKLNLSAGIENGQRNIHLDALFKAPNNKSIIYCGDYHAASDLSLLKKFNINYIVNCTRPCPSGELPNYHEGVVGYKYFNFPIAIWQACVATPGNKRGKYGENLPEVAVWFGGLVAFIDDAIANGQCILIHCLAGAHRAGSTSIALLMHYANLDYEQALIVAKICRPIIDPIGNLPTLLRMYDSQRVRPKDLIERNVRMVGNLAMRNMTPAPTPESSRIGRASFSNAEDLRGLRHSSSRIGDAALGSIKPFLPSASFGLLPATTARDAGAPVTLAISPLDSHSKLPGLSAGYSLKKTRTRRKSSFN